MSVSVHYVSGTQSNKYPSSQCCSFNDFSHVVPEDTPSYSLKSSQSLYLCREMAHRNSSKGLNRFLWVDESTTLIQTEMSLQLRWITMKFCSDIHGHVG